MGPRTPVRPAWPIPPCSAADRGPGKPGAAAALTGQGGAQPAQSVARVFIRNVHYREPN